MADKTQYYELEKTNPIKPTNLNTQIDNNLVKIDTVMHENSVKAEGKQDKLVSGTNIKTINSQSILGSGDIVITGGSAVWGGITGTISNQTDLMNKLATKEDKLPTAVKGLYLHANVTTGAMEWASAGSGSVNWGGIGGNIADQTDLQEALADKSKVVPETAWTIGADTAKALVIDGTTYNLPQGVKWGEITGSLGNQTDINNALSSKVSKLTDVSAFSRAYIQKTDGKIGSMIIAEQIDSDGLVSGNMVKNYVDVQDTLLIPKTSIVNDYTGGADKVASAETVKSLNNDKQDKLPTVVKGKYLHSNATTGDYEWDTPTEIDDTLTSASDRTYSINKIIDLIQTMGSTFRGSFPTKADLDAYPGPMDENDIAIVQQDETHEQYATVYRYVSEVWTFQYEIKVAFTQSQWDTINAGISKTWKANVEKSIEDEIVRAKSEEAKAIQLLGKEAGSGEEYHFTYFYDFEVKPDTITAHVDTITLDNKRTLKRFSKDLPGATFDDEGYFATAGLYNQTVEDAVNGKVTKLKTAVNTRMDGIEENLSNEINRAKNVESDLEANKISLLGKEAGSGEEYHFPFNVTGIKQELESIDVTFDTITLDNKKTIKGYTLSIPSADIFGNDKAGLFTVGINDDINMRIDNARTALETSISLEVDRATARENELDTNKADKTALNDKISLLGNEIGSGEPYHFTYFYDVKPKSDGIGITIDTITLDNNKTTKKYDMTVPLANVSGNTAGLYGKSIDDTLVKHTEMVEMTSAEIDALIGGW